MAKATIIEDFGGGGYSIKRNWAGRVAIQEKIDAYNAAITKLQSEHDEMPQTTDEELFEKHIVALQIQSLQSKVNYLQANFPEDAIKYAWCADYTVGLTGEVGTIDIAGEYTSDVNIRPGYVDEDDLEEEIDEVEADIITAKNDLAKIPKITAEMEAINFEINWRTTAWNLMPETTPEEIAAKASAKLIIEDLQKDYLELYGDQQRLIATATRRLATLEATLVCLQNVDADRSAFCAARDGELYPGIALGPWTSFLNQCIYPGWQKFKPLHRYAWILEDTINYTENTCAIAIQPTFSLMNFNVNQAATGGGEPPAAEPGIKSSRVKNYNVNIGDPIGTDEIVLLRKEVLETAAASKFFVQNSGMAHPGFLDFVARNPTHPISTTTKLNSPIYLSDEQYIQLERICSWFDYSYFYESDRSGYEISDYWNVMYDIGDPWFQVPEYVGEPQQEFTFGNINLLLDESGLAIRSSDETLDDFLQYDFLYGTSSINNVKLQYKASRNRSIGPKQRRRGDCEDYVLTKMQAIWEAGIVPMANMQVLLCYVVNAGYHAVLGIQTANRGFLISDQRDYGQLWEIEQLSKTHIWESFSIATAAGGVETEEATVWAKSQYIIQNVPIEYMGCNSDAFVDDDEVIVEFTDQSWDQPKVIGFKENPKICSAVYVFPAQQQWRYEAKSRTMKLSYNSDAWAWKDSFPRDYSYPGQDQLSRVSYAATGENGLGFTVGGRTISDTEDPKYFFNHLDIFDSAAESFSIGADYPENIFDLSFNSLKNGKCIAHGGRITWADRGQTRTRRYAISSDTWSLRAFGAKVYDHASFAIDSIVYIVGGSSGDGSGGTSYYGADNFGFGISDFYVDRRGQYIPNQTVTAYNDSEQSWSQKKTCPVANFVNVKGWNLEGKGLVGGGAYTYQYDEFVYAGSETFFSCPGGGKYLDISDALDECGQDAYKEHLQVHWVHLDIGLKENNESYLYDNLTDSWTKKQDIAGGGEGSQATSTVRNETVALAFSGSRLTHWYDYKLSTDTWTDKGLFGLTVNDDPDWYSHRLNAAGAEL